MWTFSSFPEVSVQRVCYSLVHEQEIQAKEVLHTEVCRTTHQVRDETLAALLVYHMWKTDVREPPLCKTACSCGKISLLLPVCPFVWQAAHREASASKGQESQLREEKSDQTQGEVSSHESFRHVKFEACRSCSRCF